MKLIHLILVSFLLVQGRNTADYYPKCKRSDPDIEKCFLDWIETIRPRLKAGIPEINLSPLDPFMMDSLAVNSSVTGLSLIGVATNIKAYGGSDFKIESLRIDLNIKYAADIKLTFPRLDISADFTARGSRMLFFQYDGSGHFNGSFSGVTVEADVTASPDVRDEVEYLKVDTIKIKVSIGKAEMEVSPFERSLTGSLASSFVKGSSSFILRIIKPVIDEIAATIVKEYLNNVLSTVPIADVLID